MRNSRKASLILTAITVGATPLLAAENQPYDLPNDPTQLAMACAATEMMWSTNQMVSGKDPDPRIDNAANAWIDKAAALSRQDRNTLLSSDLMRRLMEAAPKNPYYVPEVFHCRDTAPLN